MAKQYKVWIEIEQCDEEQDEYITLDAPDAAVATFDSYAEAWDFAEKLQHHGYIDVGDWPEFAGHKAAKRKARREQKQQGDAKALTMTIEYDLTNVRQVAEHESQLEAGVPRSVADLFTDMLERMGYTVRLVGEDPKTCIIDTGGTP
jgi:hypothetical protein